jgi:hypothetical protein
LSYRPKSAKAFERGHAAMPEPLEAGALRLDDADARRHGSYDARAELLDGGHGLVMPGPDLGGELLEHWIKAHAGHAARSLKGRGKPIRKGHAAISSRAFHGHSAR